MAIRAAEGLLEFLNGIGGLYILIGKFDVSRMPTALAIRSQVNPGRTEIGTAHLFLAAVCGKSEGKRIGGNRNWYQTMTM